MSLQQFVLSIDQQQRFQQLEAGCGAGEREAFDLVTRFPRAVIREPSGEAAARETVGECAAFVDAAASGGALFVERRASS